jgi:tetratricopeptide (TPR) repeat protein
MAAGMLDDQATALRWGQEALLIARQHGFTYELGIGGSSLALIAILAGDVALAQQLLDEVDDVARRLGNPWVLAIDIMNRGRTAAVQGDLAGAAAHFTEAGAYFRNLRDRAFYYSSRSELAHVLRRGGRHAEATGLYRETLPIWLELGHRGAAAHELESLAFIAGAQNRPAQAARLLGAAAALREVSGTAMSPPERGEYEQALAQLQAQIEPAAFVTAWAAGAALDLEQILAYALEA